MKNFLLIGKEKIGYITNKSQRGHLECKDCFDPLPMWARKEEFFEDVDNPGQYPSSSFWPVYKKEKGFDMYKHYCLPIEENIDGVIGPIDHILSRIN